MSAARCIGTVSRIPGVEPFIRHPGLNSMPVTIVNTLHRPIHLRSLERSDGTVPKAASSRTIRGGGLASPSGPPTLEARRTMGPAGNHRTALFAPDHPNRATTP